MTLPEPPAKHDAWIKGTNSASGGLRSMRMVMPLGMAIGILEHVNLKIFTEQAGAVECLPSQLESPEQEVCFLNCRTLNGELRCSPM